MSNFQNTFIQTLNIIYEMYVGKAKRITVAHLDSSITLHVTTKSYSSYLSTVFPLSVSETENKGVVFSLSREDITNDVSSTTEKKTSVPTNKTYGRHVINLFLNSVGYKERLDEFNKNDEFTIDHDELQDFMDKLVRFIETSDESLTRSCPLCYRKKSTDCLEITPCEECKPDSYDKTYDDCVTDCYNYDKNIFRLLLYTSLEAIDTEARFTPVPLYCQNNIYDKMYLGIDAVNRNIEYYLTKLEIAKTDRDLFKTIKKTEYMFLKHIILSNGTKLNYFNDTKNGFIDVEQDIWSKNNKKCIVFTVLHPIEKQKQFNSNPNVVHMFHGSSTYNWYSIMRNGLKNFSGTNMMTNGQVYGPGIYLANNISTASSYCKQSRDDNKKIIGVVQLLNSEKYKKTSNIYVVPEESDVLLKYLVVHTGGNQNLLEIEKYLTKELPTNIMSNIGKVAMITQKRISKELEMFNTKVKRLTRNNDNIEYVTVDQEIADEVKWNITLTLKKGQNPINIIVLYPRSFPSNPCIIKVDTGFDIPCLVRDIQADHDENGSYVYDDPILRHDRWRSNVQVYRILEQLLLNIAEFDRISNI